MSTPNGNFQDSGGANPHSQKWIAVKYSHVCNENKIEYYLFIDFIIQYTCAAHDLIKK